MRTIAALSPLTLAAALLCGCGDKPITNPPPKTPVQQTTTTAAPPAAKTPDQSGRPLLVSDDIVKACNLQLGNVETAPKFDFDKSDLSPTDRNVLQQIATCVTTGPLKGRTLKLIGRADARGEAEYNMGLGEHRADSVKRYLGGLGVPGGQVAETSRGKLDATGTDDATMQRDRRVDIALQ